MKKLLTLIGLVFGLALLTPAAQAQVINQPKLTALSKPNPAQPIFIAWATFTDLGGNDQLEIDFEVDGIGFWSCYEAGPGNATDITCLVPWIRSVGQPTLCSIVVQKSTYVSCFWNLENVHGLPPCWPPYKTH